MDDPWLAVESFLYDEDPPANAKMPYQLIQECKLWKETFPYLRIKGQQIQNPNSEKKKSLKHTVVAAVVDEIIDKFNANGLKLDSDNGYVDRPMAPNRESYFERGKKSNHGLLTSQQVISSTVVQQRLVAFTDLTRL